ncbi:MAG: hypothetical protein Q8N79_08725, partial [Candidatus Methanoperedens sp.]|nr:hypothetical protein [Candidatus Methanoperedens sp.]
MNKRFIWLAMLSLVLVLLPAVADAQENIKQVCSTCHKPMADTLDANKHKALDCAECHEPEQHPGKPAEIKPVTKLDPSVCGKCHTDQYNSLMTVNYKSKAKIEKGIPTGRSPEMDKLLMGHGFTKEHAEPRSHAFMLIDHLVVDRAYGGRF